MKPNKQKGMTLIEISIVLVIMAIIIGGALYGMSYVNKQKATSESAAYLRAVQNLREKYRKIPDTSGVTTANAVAGNVFDNGLDVDTVAGTVTNAYQGLVTVVPATTTTANDSFLLTTTAVNDIGCEKIPLLMNGAGIDKVIITGSAAVTVKATLTAALSPAAIDAACNNDSNTLAITFRRSGG